MKIGILEPDDFSQEVILKLSQIGKVQSYHHDTKFEEFLFDKDILFIRLGYQIDNSFLNYCDNLKILCSPTTGETHIDKGALKKRDIKLISLKNHTHKLKNIRATPEHTIGLLIALFRNYRSAILHENNFHWNRMQCRGKEIFGSKIGIVGMGRVGLQLAKYLAVFGAQISYFDNDTNLNIPDKKYERSTTVQELINKSEAIILCASYTSNDPPILGKELLFAMRDKFLINSARGELIDQEALFMLLEKNYFAGVAVDVLSDEATIMDNVKFRELIANKNFLVTPHIAGATASAMQMTENIIFEILISECFKN